MSPFEQAQQVYEREPCARTFCEDLYHHLQHGWVVSTPTVFGMCRPVQHDWPAAWLREPWRTDPAGDCWMIWLLAGDLAKAMASLPDQRAFMAYERENQIRVLPMQRIWRGLVARAGTLS